MNVCFCPLDCFPCHFDFENGRLDGWTKSGTVFDNQPTYGDNPTARGRGQPANQQGEWWIGGAENRPNTISPAGSTQGDKPQGTLTSPPFFISGNGKLSFLIGGGCNTDYVRAEMIINNQVGMFSNKVAFLDKNNLTLQVSCHVISQGIIPFETDFSHVAKFFYERRYSFLATLLLFWGLIQNI